MDRPGLPQVAADMSEFSPDSGYAVRQKRLVSLYRVGALTVKGHRELCVVRNVSEGGLMMTTFSKIAPGTPLKVEFKQGEAVEGMIVWTNDNAAGMKFDKSVDVAKILANPSSNFRPRLPRIDIECDMTVREGAVAHDVRALDISQGGVCVETDRGLTLGADVVVRIEGLAPEAGVVRWRDGNCYGIAFNRLLSVPALANWLKDRNSLGQRQA